MSRHFNVLFLCTGNSARSIMAEAILNKKGFPNFTGYSAGSHPAGHVNPEAIKQLEAAGMPTAEMRSKSWDEFGRSGAPEMHFVFTVCDSAAAEVCGLAWAPVYRPMECPRPGSGSRHTRASQARIFRGVHNSGQAHHSVSFFTACKP
jgi:hypothetical protein